ncbi:hypothetical protein MASR1M60_20230 [Rhodocyclaceae bacterium]
MPTHSGSSPHHISADAVLNVFRQEACLAVRKLAGLLHVDCNDARLMLVINNLKRAGKLKRIAGRGRRALFILSTFEA